MTIRVQNLTKEAARAAIRACFDDLQEIADRGYVPRTSEPDLEQIEQREISLEFMRDVAGQIETGSFEGNVSGAIHRTLAQRGIELANFDDGTRLDLLNGVARALVEQQRLFLLRLDDRLAGRSAASPV